MSKKVLLTLIAAVIVVGATIGFAQYLNVAYTPYYWVIGQVDDADGGSIPADGFQVIFYENSQTYNTKYASAVVAGNVFNLNAFNFPGAVPVAGSFYLAIPNSNPDNPKEGWGMNPVQVVISGYGFINVGKLVLAKGAGPMPPGTEPAPQINLWVGNRLYQPAVYTKDLPFVVEEQPLLSCKINIQEPYGLAADPSAYSIVIDPATTNKELPLSASNMTAKSFAAGEMRAFTLEYQLQEEDKLADGEHLIEIIARSSGSQGDPGTSVLLATMEVMGGPVRLIGTPITYPSPYSIKKDKTVTIQYGLSKDANIEIYVVGVTGQRIKRYPDPAYSMDAGTEGGSAGINKVTWDGKTDQGYYAGNGIYVGTINARDENRLLGKFKLTIVN
jgi:hypothetical protein